MYEDYELGCFQGEGLRCVEAMNERTCGIVLGSGNLSAALYCGLSV